MSLRRPKFLHTITVAFAVMLPLASSAVAVTVQEITEKNRPSIQGKEVDWIDGDYILMNDQIVVVIARPGKTRDANMTTCLLYTSPSPRDLSTSRMPSSA